MSVDVSISSNIMTAIDEMQAFEHDVVLTASRTALNRAMVSGRKFASKRMRERLNLKPGLIKKGVTIKKAKGGRVSSLTGFIFLSAKPIPIIEFVKGNKNVIKQKGVRVKRRRKLKVEITRGKKFHMKGAFIQRVRSKQVFKMGNSGKFYKQSAPSIAEWMSKGKFKRPTIQHVLDTFDKNLRHELKFRMDKAHMRVKNGQIRKL